MNIYRRLFNNAIKFTVMHKIKLIKINKLHVSKFWWSLMLLEFLEFFVDVNRVNFKI